MERGQVTVELATASYHSWVRGMGVPVATSLGRPKRSLSFGYELVEEVGALKPWGLLDAPDEVFTERYRARLDKLSTSKLWRIFHTISARYDGARLVLLCWEDVLCEQKPCHRRDWADWWAEQTGKIVPELSWVCGTDGVPVVVTELHHRW
jgi:hypothetical protein